MKESKNQGSDYSIGKTSQVDMRLLGVFMAVVRSGGFSPAQEPLDMALSSISTYITELETRLGFRLCNRGRGGFSLTANGRSVFREAERLFAAMEAFQRNTLDLNGKLTGELTIGLLDNSTMSPSTRLPAVIHQFAQLQSDVHIRIKVLNSEEIAQGLTDGDLHVGIGLFNDSGNSLREVVSFPVSVDLYCGSTSPVFGLDEIRPGDLQQTGYARGCYCPSRQAEAAVQLPPPTATAYLSEGLAFLILSGRYVGYLPRRYAANWVSNGEMRALPSIYSHEVEQSLVVRRGEVAGPVLEAFLNCFAAFRDEGEPPAPR